MREKQDREVFDTGEQKKGVKKDMKLFLRLSLKEELRRATCSTVTSFTWNQTADVKTTK